MYPRNAASPPKIAIGPVVQISDGAVQTSGCTVSITPEGGSETTATNAASYLTSGVVCIVLTQAETNYSAFIVTAYKTGCIPATITVVTTAVLPGTIDTTGFTPTTTEFEADDITEATADHFNGRVVVFTSGVLLNQATRITDYAIATGRGHFTVEALTEAAGNNDTFTIF